MGHRETRKAMKTARFGWRRFGPRACLIESKQHIRRFLAEVLKELGFVTYECSHGGELSALLDGQSPDLVVLGLSAGGIETVAVLESLAARAFDGKVLLLGHGDSLMEAVQAFGKDLGLMMLPTLTTPFNSGGLRTSVTALLPPAPRRASH